MGVENPGVDHVGPRVDALDPQGHHREIRGDVLLARYRARSRLAQKSLRAVHPNGPLRSRYAREKPCGETGAASQIKRQPWTGSHGFGDERLTDRIEDLRDD